MLQRSASMAVRPAAPKARRVLFLAALAALMVSIPFWVNLGFSLPPEKACNACHEMREVVSQWQESGSADQHVSCTDCHFDRGIAGFWQKNRTALTCVVAHLARDGDASLRPAPEPLSIEPGREPAYYSCVPNRRCFQCKDTPGHRPIEQSMSHQLLIDFPVEQPCKDCHNHDMRNGQKFYEKILSSQDTVTMAGPAVQQ